MNKKLITPDNLSQFAYTNFDITKKPYKGIIVDFMGLGGMIFTDEAPYDFPKKSAEKNILFVLPYLNPWNWMNDISVKITDMIIDAMLKKANLDLATTKLVYTGGSMGGQCAITYSNYAKMPPVACAVNCPVCDSVYHDTERKDVPRTYISSFFHYDMKMVDAIKTVSPIELVDTLPKIPYYIVHGQDDEAVNIKLHSQPFAQKMEKAGFDITFDSVPGMKHCNISGNNEKRYYNFIYSFFE